MGTLSSPSIDLQTHNKVAATVADMLGLPVLRLGGGRLEDGGGGGGRECEGRKREGR